MEKKIYVVESRYYGFSCEMDQIQTVICSSMAMVMEAVNHDMNLWERSVLEFEPCATPKREFHFERQFRIVFTKGGEHLVHIDYQVNERELDNFRFKE